ncbi:hypothetical protein CHMI_03785 [Cellulomonas hominis]|nr:hypothetical protein CHMI_03785 [Cellulomonas hominis]
MAEVDQVVDDQEVPGEAELLDHPQLVLELGVGAGHPLVLRRPVALEGAAADELAQPGGLGVPRRHRVRRQLRRDQVQVEGGLVTERGGVRDGVRVPAVPVQHLRGGVQVRGRCAGQPAVEVLHRGPGAHGSQCHRQVGVPRGGVVDVAGGDQRQTGVPCERRQRVGGLGVERAAGLRDLHGDVVPAEQRDEAVQLGARPADPGGGDTGLPAVVGERPADGSLPAAGEDEPPAGGLLGELLEPVRGGALGAGGQVRLGDGPGQRPIPVGSARDDGQVHGPGVGHAGRGVEHVGAADTGDGQVQLGTEHGGQADLARRLGEPDDAVQAVVVGEAERAEPEPVRLGGELLGLAGAVEEAERRVRVQLRVAGGVSHRRPRRSSRRAGRRAAGPGRRRA